MTHHPPAPYNGAPPAPTKRKLTTKQKNFAHYLAETKDVVRAALKAGYGNTASARRLLQDKDVMAEMERHLMEGLAPLKRLQIIAALEGVAFTPLTDLAAWTATGVKVRPSAQLNRSQAAAVSEVSITPNAFGRSVKIKTHDRNTALQALAKAYNLINADGSPNINILNAIQNNAHVEEIRVTYVEPERHDPDRHPPADADWRPRSG